MFNCIIFSQLIYSVIKYIILFFYVVVNFLLVKKHVTSDGLILINLLYFIYVTLSAVYLFQQHIKILVISYAMEVKIQHYIVFSF